MIYEQKIKITGTLIGLLFDFQARGRGGAFSANK